MAEPSNSVFKFRFDPSAAGQVSKLDFNVLWRISDGVLSSPLAWLYFPITIAYCITFAWIPALVGDIFDVCLSALTAVFFNLSTEFAFVDLKDVAIKAVLLVAVNCFLAVLQGIIAAKITSDFSDKARNSCFEKLNRLPAGFLDVYSHESVMSCMTESVDTLDQSINLILVRMITALIMVPTIIVRLIFVDTYSAFISMGIVFLTFVATRISERSVRKASAKRYLSEEIPVNYSRELCLNIQQIRNSGRLADYLKIISDGDKTAKPAVSARYKSCIPACICEAGTGICIIAVLIFCSLSYEYVTVGLLMSLMLYIHRLFQPINQASTFSGVLVNASDSGKNIFGFLDEKEENKSGSSKIPYGDIVFKNVSFAYPAGKGMVFNNSSFVIPSRGITAIQGKTGAGKSTIIKLILRFYLPNRGVITLGGVNINHLNMKEFRSRFSVITQEATLFPGTVFENIVYGTGVKDTNLVARVCSITGADKFILKLPGGYAAKVRTEPCNLSSGEIQLILLSRALLKNPQFIIFDEATSFVDSDSEKLIKDILKRLSQDRGVIVISHRQSAVSDAVQTLFVDNGIIKTYRNK